MEDKINNLDAQKSQIESKYLLVTSYKQQLQRHMQKIDEIKKNNIGELFKINHSLCCRAKPKKRLSNFG